MQVAITSLERGLAAHDLEQPHHVRRTEKVRADDPLRPRGGRRDFVDVQRGRVGRKDRALFDDLVQLAEDLLLQRHSFEDRLYHHVDAVEAVVGQRRRDASHTLIHLFLAEAALLHGIRVVLFDGGESAIERGLIGLLEQHRNARIGEHHRNAAAHRARAHNCRLVDRNLRDVLRNTGNLRDFAFAKENMNQPLRLV